jgi:hypothetical protein
MRRTMVHPYYGYLVVCAECDGMQHDQAHEWAYSWCDVCLRAMLDCVTCGKYITCCPCGTHHAEECPWPL